MENKEKLNAKIRAKSARRKPKQKNQQEQGGESLEMMLENFNKMLKTNPQMVQQISRCVSGFMENKELMESLKQQIQTNPSSSPVESLEALSKESKQ